MKHESSKALYRYWDTLRDGEPAPARTAISPAEISDHLRDTFILQSADGVYPFRLAGTRMCAIFGRELKSTSFLDLWSQPDREHINALLSAVAVEGQGAVIGVRASGRRGQSIDLELLLLPLVQAGPHFDRIFGAMAPMQLPYWLGLESLAGLTITSARLLWPDGESHLFDDDAPPEVVPLPLQTLDADQRRSKFIVLDGGKSE